MKLPATTIKTWDSQAMHPLQTWAWGEFRKSMGIDVVRTTSGWQVMFHKIPHTPWTIGYFPKGPKIAREMIQTLETLGKERNAIYIQIEPHVTSGNQLLPPSHHPLFTKYTFVLDLTKSEEQLLGAMHPKTRYNIKVAQKHGVTIQEEEALETFLKLNDETLKRQRFYAHNDLYYQRMWHHLHPTGIARLFTARYGDIVLAAWIIFAWKDTIYYPYGASSRQNREVMAPNLLLWEIAQWAKKEGYKKFDLWGALGPNPDSNDPWYGFHHFKEGFSPELVEFVGSYDLVISPTLYKIYTRTDALRWMFLRMRR